MANRKFTFINSDLQIEEEQLSVSTSSGSGDSGKLVTLDADGKFDVSLLPDSIINDRDWKDSVRVATTAALPASTYDNGTAGVGATLTADANGALPAIDGVTLSVNDELLVKNQAAGLQNGIYVVTQVGDGSNPFILTRRTDADEDSEMTAGQHVPITEGTANGDKFAYLTTNDPITVGTTALSYNMANLSALSGGDGIDITANVISVDIAATDSGLEFVSGELLLDFADTSVTADLDGTNGDLPVRVEDIYLNGANQGANIIGVDPSSIAQSSATDLQTVLEDMSSAIDDGQDYVTYTTSAAVNAGDLVFVSGNDTCAALSVTSSAYGIGLAATTQGIGTSVNVLANDEVITGVLSGATAGDKYYWNGTALSTTAPTGTGQYVWLAGVAKNATDLHVAVEYIKRNSL